MPKGYWIVHVDVSDPETYRKYVEANAEPIARFGGRFLVRGGPAENVEGSARARNVVIEFPSIEAARACYRTIRPISAQSSCASRRSIARSSSSWKAMTDRSPAD